MKRIRPLAIYLPQFHRIPENDTWWGKGFTEWTNVKKARRLFRGHYQPHIPAGPGYYDLSDPEVLVKQAEMARSHGIFGFCIYHYWFNGKRLLNLPLDNILKLGKPDFPFCLTWANENWTRAWDGATGVVLMQQNYNYEDDLQHIRFLLTVFSDKRYIRIDAKPVFIIYRPALFPDIKKTLETWRREALRYGLPGLYLCYFENEIQGIDPSSIGFDAAVEFQPNWYKLRFPSRKKETVMRNIHPFRVMDAAEKHWIFDYREVVEWMIEVNRNIAYRKYRCLMPMWDNSPRRKLDAAIFSGSTPELYGQWLDSVLNNFIPFSKEENLVFLNAWNEWGEGNHLEPCRKWGDAYLKKTKESLDKHQ